MEASLIIKLLFWTTMLVLTFYHFFYRYYIKRERFRKLRKTGRRAIATIVEILQEKDLDGLTLNFPTYEFTDDLGQMIRVTDTVGESELSRSCKVGQQVSIYFNSNPQDFVVENYRPWEVFLIPFGLAITAIIVYEFYITFLRF